MYKKMYAEMTNKEQRKRLKAMNKSLDESNSFRDISMKDNTQSDEHNYSNYTDEQQEVEHDNGNQVFVTGLNTQSNNNKKITINDKGMQKYSTLV